jgi:hypothetical protein
VSIIKSRILSLRQTLPGLLAEVFQGSHEPPGEAAKLVHYQDIILPLRPSSIVSLNLGRLFMFSLLDDLPSSRYSATLCHPGPAPEADISASGHQWNNPQAAPPSLPWHKVPLSSLLKISTVSVKANCRQEI